MAQNGFDMFFHCHSAGIFLEAKKSAHVKKMLSA